MKTEWFTSDRLGERYCRITTKGRPQIYVFPKQMSSIYAVCAVKYGSVDRCYRCRDGNEIILPDGIAHFLEHKMFACPDGRDAFDVFSQLGADANAYTSYDRTVYLFNCTSNFDRSLVTLIDMMTHPHFTSQNVLKERGIIEQEIAMYDDDPDIACNENMLAALYKDHPVRVNICGTARSISQITPELLYECHKTFYNPENMVIAVCGPVEVDRVADIVCNYEKWGQAVEFERCVAPELDLPYKTCISRRMQVAIPLFTVGFKETVSDPSPEVRHRRDIVASILERMLFSASGNLYNELYDSGSITAPLSVGRIAEEGYAFTELCGMAWGPEAVVEKIASHIKKTRVRGLSNFDFVRCKRRRLGDAISRFDSVEEIANAIIGYAFDGLDMLLDPDIIESVSFDEVCELFEQMYHEQSMAVSYVMPLK